MKPRRRFGLALGCCLLLLLSACGNKGPLELPERDQTKRERNSNY